ncbi:MAG: zinc-ribbon domain-containing protein [Chloroflexi bacterium]|nr:zinc-ribbon domain-containing protein [Chloroflexota bacterium]
MVWLALLLLLGTVAAIGYPLLRPRPRAPAQPDGGPAASELVTAKEAAYAALKELEFDYRAGSLSQEDYRELEVRYKRKAASLLQAEDAQKFADSRRAQIEEAVRRLRTRAPSTSAIEAEILRLRRGLSPSQPQSAASPHPKSGAARFCTQCGSPGQPEDRFCAHCGHPLVPSLKTPDTTKESLSLDGRG